VALSVAEICRTEGWVYDAFVRAELPRYPLTEWSRLRSKDETRASIKADVAKLRSVSPAGQRWIVSERMKWAGWADDGNFHFKPSHPRMYFQPARQGGKTAALHMWKQHYDLPKSSDK